MKKDFKWVDDVILDTTPRFKHFNGVFMGSYEKYDLYFHPKDPFLIARFGHKNWQYVCGIDISERSKILWITKQIALKLKYL